MTATVPTTRPPRVRTSASAAKKATPGAITPAFIRGVNSRISQGKPVHRVLPLGGRLHIDRELPFLVVYRRPGDRVDEGTEQLVKGEASHLVGSASTKARGGFASLVDGVVAGLSKSFGAVLIIEVWAAVDEGSIDDRELTFSVKYPKSRVLTSTVNALETALSEVKVKGEFAQVTTSVSAKVAAPGMKPLLTAARAAELNCHIIGIEVPPVYRDLETEQTFPLVRRAIHKGLSRSIQRTVFEFTRKRTSHRPAHYQAMGRRSFVKTLWDVDRALADVSNSFDFLLQISPVNADEAWSGFRRKRFEVEPEFTTRPLRIDPSIIKRELFKIPMEKVEDPTLAQILRDQQSEIDRKLTMLSDRGTPKFLYGSLQVYGGVDAALLTAAYDILARVPSRSRDESLKAAVDAQTFAAAAERELDYYRLQLPELKARVEIRSDVAALTVSRGNLMVPASAKIPHSRVDALIAHEVGTHIVTYTNGRAQRFRQLYVGLPGYEELQEGMAVLAEYLAGGLSRPRMRLLAARVVATHRMIEGASFVEVFRELDRAHDFAQRTAFNVTMRVFRGGGLTKDVSYLRGLLGVLDHLRTGGDFESLLVGKFGPEHIPIIEELRWRKVLVDSPLRPRYLDDPVGVARLESLRKGASVLDLVSTKSKTKKKAGIES